MHLGDKLIKIRKENKMSQEKFAEKLNVTRQTVSNWENYKSYPDIATLIKISDLFYISLDILLKGDLPMIKSMDKKIKNHKKLTMGIITLSIILLLIFVAYGILLYLVPEKVPGGFRFTGVVDVVCTYPNDEEMRVQDWEKASIRIYYNKVYKYPVGLAQNLAYNHHDEQNEYIKKRYKEEKVEEPENMLDKAKTFIRLVNESGASCDTKEFDELDLKDEKKK